MITCEYPPQPGGVSDNTALVAAGLREHGLDVRVWCREFEGFTAAGLRRVDRMLDQCPPPRRLFVQWAPHGYGCRSMNLAFCRWVAARGRRDELDLMVHEPGLGFGEGSVRHHAAAAVHRVMAVLLMRSATRVWISIPAWESRLRPYTLGRNIPIECLPVPSNIPVAPPAGTHEDFPVGYFGQYDAPSITFLRKILDGLPYPVVLMGRGAEAVPPHPRARVLGELEPTRLSHVISACRIMCHLYRDGVSSRRSTFMASLAHGKPVVTVEGRLSEPIWRQSNAVALSPVGDFSGYLQNIKRLLDDDAERLRLGCAARNLYQKNFSLERTLSKLTR